MLIYLDRQFPYPVYLRLDLSDIWPFGRVFESSSGLHGEFLTPDEMILSLVHLGTNDDQALKMMQKITQQTMYIVSLKNFINYRVIKKKFPVFFTKVVTSSLTREIYRQINHAIFFLRTRTPKSTWPWRANTRHLLRARSTPRSTPNINHFQRAPPLPVIRQHRRCDVILLWLTTADWYTKKANAAISLHESLPRHLFLHADWLLLLRACYTILEQLQ